MTPAAAALGERVTRRRAGGGGGRGGVRGGAGHDHTHPPRRVVRSAGEVPRPAGPLGWVGAGGDQRQQAHGAATPFLHTPPPPSPLPASNAHTVHRRKRVTPPPPPPPPGPFPQQYQFHGGTGYRRGSHWVENAVSGGCGGGRHGSGWPGGERGWGPQAARGGSRPPALETSDAPPPPPRTSERAGCQSGQGCAGARQWWPRTRAAVRRPTATACCLSVGQRWNQGGGHRQECREGGRVERGATGKGGGGEEGGGGDQPRTRAPRRRRHAPHEPAPTTPTPTTTPLTRWRPRHGAAAVRGAAAGGRPDAPTHAGRYSGRGLRRGLSCGDSSPHPPPPTP